MQGEVLGPQASCPDKASPAKNGAAATPAAKVGAPTIATPDVASSVPKPPPRSGKRSPTKVPPPPKPAQSDVVLADVAIGIPAVATVSTSAAPPPSESKLPATLSNTSWKMRQNLPFTIIVPPTPWSDSPVYEHAVALRVVPDTWRKRLFGKRDEPRSRYLPCWLTSLVLHMAAIIILGSLASSPTRQFAARTMQLLISSSNDELHAQADLVTFETGPRHDQITNNSLSPIQTAQKISLDPFETPTEKRPIEPPAIKLVAPTPSPQPPVALPASPPAKTNPANPAAPVAPVIVGRLTQNFGGEAAGLDTTPLPSRPISERQMDDVVERFTQYDIGKLQGEAGKKARRDFEALGPEAIPALVRGLNKAAQISASCPVMVISSKLDSSLGSNRDPTALKYALDNLGRDVPKTARHNKVIEDLKKKWLERTPPAIVATDPQTLADILTGHGIPVTDRLRQHMDRLSKASSDTLARALVGSDKDDPVAATAILIQRQGEVPDHQKPKIIRGLIRQLKNEGTRLATCKALALLVDYPNYKPRERPEAKPGNKPVPATNPLDSPADKLVESAQHMEMFEGPLPPYRRYRPMVVEFLEATDANAPEATAAK
jgi:hypothetical protein